MDLRRTAMFTFGAVGGSMLAAAFLPISAASADSGDGFSLAAGDGFTYSYAGDTAVDPNIIDSPFLEVGQAPDLELTLIDSAGDPLGSFTSDVAAANLLGFEMAQFSFDEASFRVDEIASALAAAGYGDDDFTGGDLDAVADALFAGDVDVLGGDVDAAGVADVLADAGLGLSDDAAAGAGAAGIADALNGYDFVDADALSDVVDGYLDESGVSFSGGDVGDAAAALADGLDSADVVAGDVSGQQVWDALSDAGLGVLGPTGPSGGVDYALAGIASSINDGQFVDEGSIEDALSDAGFGDDSVEGGGLADLVSAVAGSDAVSAADVVAGDLGAGAVADALDDAGLSVVDGESGLDGVADALNGGEFVDEDGLPVDGAVYNVTNLGLGIVNVFEAVPDEDGGLSAVSDVLLTPLGNFPVPVFDFGSDVLDAGDAFGGDWLAGLFG